MIVSNNVTHVHVGHVHSFDIYNQYEFLDVNIMGKNICLINLFV